MRSSPMQVILHGLKTSGVSELPTWLKVTVYPFILVGVATTVMLPMLFYLRKLIFLILMIAAAIKVLFFM